jgi:hypothetical protein
MFDVGTLSHSSVISVCKFPSSRYSRSLKVDDAGATRINEDSIQSHSAEIQPSYMPYGLAYDVADT